MELSLKVFRSTTQIEKLRSKVNRWQGNPNRAYKAVGGKRAMIPIELMGKLLLRCPDTGLWAPIPAEILQANI